MPGPQRARRDIVAELHSGLLDAIDAHRSAGLSAVFPAVGAALLTVISSALATVTATGKLARWLPASPRTAAAAAAAAGFGAAAADLAIFALLASELTSAPGALAPLPVAAAAAASLTRFTFAPRAARRCLAMRATLTLGRVSQHCPLAADDIARRGG